MSEALFQPPEPTTPAAPPAPTMPAGFKEAAPSENAVTRDVQKNETVQGQLETLFKANNPVLEQARQNGVRQSAERGLQNTSFGAQIGEQAFIGKAADIANADAGSYQKAAGENLQAVNQSNLQRLQTAGRLKEAEKGFEYQSKLSKQSFEQSKDLSTQGFEQALQLSEKDYQETLGQLAKELENSKAMSALDQQELLQQLTFEHNNTLAQLGEKARLDVIQSQLDQAEAEQFETLRSQLEEVRMLKASDLRRQEMEAEIQNKLREIEASAGAQMDVNREQDARRLQLTYLQESGAIVRQAMQDIANVSSAQGLSVAQQQGAVADIRAQLQRDLNLIQTLYAQSPDWTLGGTAPLPGGPSTGPPGLPFPNAPAPTTPSLPGITPGETINGPTGPITLPYTPVIGRPAG